MAVDRAMGRGRRAPVGAALPNRGPAEAAPAERVGFVSAYDRLRLHELAAQELAACDAGNLAEALRLSELYEAAERKALGLTGGTR